MDCKEDESPLFVDVALDEMGREALEYGYDQDDEYKSHFKRLVLSHQEFDLIDAFLLTFVQEFNVFIDRGEFSTLPNKDVLKAKALTETFAQQHPEARGVCDKLISQFNVAIKSGNDIEFT
jgi:hypothetical protein